MHMHGSIALIKLTLLNTMPMPLPLLHFIVFSTFQYDAHAGIYYRVL